MNIYYLAKKKYPHKLGKDYFIYVRFSTRANPEKISESLNRKIKDFGSDKYNSLSMTFVYKNVCKNFMLEMKRQLLKNEDIKEVSIREIK